ncbi:MAG: hypothetical protein NC245_02285 [Muribaculum sp.]|nr:hypothetical protein [Muribaculum sp.]
MKTRLANQSAVAIQKIAATGEDLKNLGDKFGGRGKGRLGAAQSLSGKAGRVDIASVHHKDIDGKEGEFM